MPMAAADDEQGRYFHELLTVERAELEERLERLHTQAMKLTAMGEERKARNKRKIIRALEGEAHTIDRMLKALRNRLGAGLEVPRLDG